MITMWASELKALVTPIKELNDRYILKPGKNGPILYCETCCRSLGEMESAKVGDILNETLIHDKNIHP